MYRSNGIIKLLKPGLAVCLISAASGVLAVANAQHEQLSRVDERVTNIDISGDGSVVAYSTFRGASVSSIAEHAFFYKSLADVCRL